MQNVIENILLSTLMIIGSGILTAADAATMQTDPARWANEDMTPQARYQTAKKEAEAAYRENKTQCKSVATAERKSCLKETQTNFQQEMKEAKALLKQ